MLDHNYKSIMLNCKCSCGDITFIVPHEPEEIARCFCSICSKYSKSSFVCFAKYQKNDINTIMSNMSNMSIIRSSKRAIRGFCSVCKDNIFMIYNDSNNIWINTNTFTFSYEHIDTYDIFNTLKNT